MAEVPWFYNADGGIDYDKIEKYAKAKGYEFKIVSYPKSYWYTAGDVKKLSIATGMVPGPEENVEVYTAGWDRTNVYFVIFYKPIK